MATVMTWNRKRVFIDSAWMQQFAATLYYTQASDGVWVPECDMAQYETGRRQFDEQPH